MYKTLIIDDNRLAIDSLAKAVPWSEYGLELVGAAYNGKQGCDMIRSLRPDIVLSDIHMPEMDGLQMMDAMREELRHTRVIFITAYDRIEYASKAIKLSAFDFILKPVDDEELRKSLLRAVASLDKEHSEQTRHQETAAVARRARFLSALGLSQSGSSPSVFLSFMDQMPETYFVMVVQGTRGGISNPILQRLDFIEFPDGVETASAYTEGNIVLLCSVVDPELKWQTMANKVADALRSNLLDITVSISAPHKDVSQLRQAYDEALRTQLQHNLYGKHSAVDYYEAQDSSLSKRAYLTEIEQACTYLAVNVDKLTPEEIWQRIVAMSKGNFRMLRVCLMFFCTKVTRDKMSHSSWGDSTDLTVYDLPKLSGEEAAESWLNRFLREVKTNNVPAKVSLVRDVLAYIKTNVTDGLALEDVAAKFYISPNYLSALIRKETGTTYRQHVLNAKIAMAKQMMEDTRMHMEDIASAIGYENYISFYNVFKKNVGMSPTEYRYNKQT